MTQGRHPTRGPREAPSLTLVLLLVAVTAATTTQGDGWCCSLAPPACRAACYRVPLWGLGGRDADHHLTHLTSICPPTLVISGASFAAEVTEGAGWWGRPCCKLALAPGCQAVCLSAGNAPQLGSACRASHEIEFFRCIQRTEEGAGCCARTQSYRCRASCEAVFTARTPSRRLRHQLAKDCRAHAHVTRCAHALTKTTPAHRPERNLHCCTASEAASCRAACRRVLTSAAPQQDILEQLEAACGPLDLTVSI
ncbi:Reversion-inducing cysteine-rich protein with Kazal motifs [Chionoecetes opilio]|uniref:Reversion-inducing cysteine-rich protein with Kazal motifs n=1 Tax=Chionoecetes opilio TaxID=41210 RepID=A0A8J5D1P7_CHIOP|nr:Reversion-inducing cysteine-rich protein with Kazal motifs [Chionoecetes opilio]